MRKTAGIVTIIEAPFLKLLGMLGGLTHILIPEIEFSTSVIQMEVDFPHAQS
jgi:hypothetical protein